MISVLRFSQACLTSVLECYINCALPRMMACPLCIAHAKHGTGQMHPSIHSQCMHILINNQVKYSWSCVRRALGRQQLLRLVCSAKESSWVDVVIECSPQDHLGWDKVHLVGHSMGSMVAAKIASLMPSRILSLALISPSNGGMQAIPKSLTAFWLCLRVNSHHLTRIFS